jgi:uncharacterized membrane protein
VLFAVFLVAGFLYVPAAAYSKAERFDPSPTLNALAQYERSSPDEFEAVQWIRHSIPKGAVVLEGIPLANGRPQGDYDPAVARISRNTGRPTVLGWAGHEHQWRGGSDEPIIQRARDVEAIYRSASIQDAQSLMRRYNVQYVVVGGLERGAYGQGVEQRLASFLDVAWRNESVVIYRPRPA